MLAVHLPAAAEGYVKVAVCPYGQDKNLMDELLELKTQDADLEALDIERSHKEEELNNIFNLSMDILCIADINGYFRKINPAVEKILGYSVEELLGRPFIEFVHPDDRARTLKLMEEELSEGVPVIEFENRYRCKDGSYKWFSWTSQPWLEEGITYAVARDITKRKQIEEELSKYREHLEVLVEERTKELKQMVEQLQNEIAQREQAEMASYRLRQQLTHVTRVATMGELAASLAHEINQPLTAILSNAQATLRFLDTDTPDLHEVRDALVDIIEDDKRASGVIQRLRSLLKKGEVKQKVLDINEVVQEVVTLLKSEVAGRGVSMSLELLPELPAVCGDRIGLQQVVMNLILNACEAMTDMEPDSRKLVIQLSSDQSENVIIAVRDSGPGLDEKNLNQIFEPFYTTKPAGMGMGLSISRSIIETHGGRLWGVNNPDRGATFYFTVPADTKDKS